MQATKDTDSFSIASESLASRSKKTTASRYRWNSIWEYLTFSMACSFSTYHFSAMVISDVSHDDANIIQFTMAYIFIGLPVYYMQTVIGQYTQLGTVYFKYMTPIGHGLSYSFIINLLMRSIERGLELADFLEYFITAMQKELQWTQCPPNSPIKCWSKYENCTSKCLLNVTPSALVYYKYTYLGNPVKDFKNIVYQIAPPRRLIPVLIVWFFTVVLLINSITNYKQITKVMLLLVLALLSSFYCCCIIISGFSYSLREMFGLNANNWTDFRTWCMAVANTIRLLALGRAFHILSGSYLHPTAAAGILSVVTVAVNFLLNILCASMTYACFGIIKYHAFMDDNDMKSVSHDKLFITMGIIPQVVTYMGIPQLWSEVYFGSCILLLLGNQVTHLMAIEKTICDTYPPLLQYRKYVISILCLFCVIAGIILVPKDLSLIVICIKRAVYLGEIFNVAAMSVLVCWVYGVQKLCDDIHFLSGFQPTKFWKICWYFLPVLATATFSMAFYNLMDRQVFTNRYTTHVFYIIFISPVPILATIEIFRFIRKRNLVGLFKPQERYGPPDPEDRYSRAIYNPRKEIRSRRRNDCCQHRCLLTSRVLQRIAQEEGSNEGSDVSRHDVSLF